MSWQASTWAVEQITGAAARKALLLALSNHADKAGVAYPSIKTLAAESEQSIPSVRRHLDELEDRGLIARVDRWHESGRRLSDWLVLLMSEESREKARELGWKEGARSRSDGSDSEGDGEDSAAETAEGGPSQIDRVTLSNWKGDPIKAWKGDPINLTPPYKERTGQIDGQSLSGELGRASREREASPSDQGFQAEWRAFYDRWQWADAEAPIVAQGVFRRLSPEERRLATRYAKTYLADRASTKKHVAYAGNWLKSKGWTEFVEREAKVADARVAMHARQREKYGGVVIFRGSQQAAAWAAYEARQTGVDPKSYRLPYGRVGPFDDCVVRPSEWPPSLKAAEGARDGPAQGVA